MLFYAYRSYSGVILGKLPLYAMRGDESESTASFSRETCSNLQDKLVGRNCPMSERFSNEKCLLQTSQAYFKIPICSTRGCSWDLRDFMASSTLKHFGIIRHSHCSQAIRQTGQSCTSVANFWTIRRLRLSRLGVICRCVEAPNKNRQNPSCSKFVNFSGPPRNDRTNLRCNGCDLWWI